MNKKYYITTPIYYPSADFHIGHCYTTIIADAIARYKRLNGYDVFFQTGTDEHGAKIEQKAKDAGVTPKEYVDVIIENAKNLWKSLNISYDYFIRTTDESHVKAVQKYLENYMTKGIFIRGLMKDYIVFLVNHFGQQLNLLMVNVRIAVARLKMLLKKLTF